jgi:hypothetical protein
VHAAVGTEHYAARLGEGQVAAVHTEDLDWVFGRYVGLDKTLFMEADHI